MDEHPVETVRVLLNAAGLNPPAAEVERLAKLYPGLRRSVDRFYDIEVGDEVPAAVFRAADGEVRR
jgi:hypothetical protein